MQLEQGYAFGGSVIENTVREPRSACCCSCLLLLVIVAGGACCWWCWLLLVLAAGGAGCCWCWLLLALVAAGAWCCWCLVLLVLVAAGACCCWCLLLLVLVAAGACCCWCLLLLVLLVACRTPSCIWPHYTATAEYSSGSASMQGLRLHTTCDGWLCALGLTLSRFGFLCRPHPLPDVAVRSGDLRNKKEGQRPWMPRARPPTGLWLSLVCTKAQAGHTGIGPLEPAS